MSILTIGLTALIFLCVIYSVTANAQTMAVRLSLDTVPWSSDEIMRGGSIDISGATVVLRHPEPAETIEGGVKGGFGCGGFTCGVVNDLKTRKAHIDMIMVVVGVPYSRSSLRSILRRPLFKIDVPKDRYPPHCSRERCSVKIYGKLYFSPVVPPAKGHPIKERVVVVTSNNFRFEELPVIENGIVQNVPE